MGGNFVIRKCSKNDLGWLVDAVIDGAKQGHFYYRTPITKKIIEHDMGEFIKHELMTVPITRKGQCGYRQFRTHAAILLVNGERASFLIDKTELDNSESELYYTYTKPECRKSGCFTAIYQDFLLRNKLSDKLIARCFPPSREAIRFFASRGWRRDPIRSTKNVTQLYLLKDRRE